MSLLGDLGRLAGNTLLGPIEGITGKNIVSDKATTKYGEITINAMTSLNKARGVIAGAVTGLAGGSLLIDKLKSGQTKEEEEKTEKEVNILYWAVGGLITLCTIVGIALGLSNKN